MALCVNTQRALARQGCLVQMTTGPGLFPLSHSHPGVELIFVHAGGACISTESWNTTALPGSVTIIPGESEHSTKPIHQQFRRTVVHAADDMYEMHDKITDRTSPFSVELSADAFDRCFWAARQLHSLTMPQNQSWTKVVKRLLDLIGAELETAQKSQDKNENNDAVVAAVITYMSDHLDYPEELSELAGHFNISERHLCRLFSSQLGYSPQRYWLNLRLERACHLLSAGVSITDITQLVGFESVRGFQRAFIRSFGIPPSHYRS